MKYEFPNILYKIVRDGEQTAFKKHRLDFELEITPYSFLPHFFIKDINNPYNYSDLFCLSHLLSQQIFLLDNFVDGQQKISSNLLRCFHTLTIINENLSRKIDKSVHKQLNVLLDRTFNVIKNEENYRGKNLDTGYLSTHPFDSYEYYTFGVDKAATWEIVPYMVGVCDGLEDSKQWVDILRRMAFVNQMFDDIIDWEIDLKKHQWTHWSYYLAAINDLTDPSILIKTLKEDERFIEIIGESLSKLLKRSAIICKDLESLGLIQLKSWWTYSKLSLMNKIYKKIEFG